MKRILMVAAAAVTLATSGPGLAAPSPEPFAEPPLQLVEMFPAPDVAGRLDHVALDPNHIRFFVSGIGNDSIEAFDFSRAEWIMSIKGMNSPKGILYVPEVQKLFSANVGDGTLKVLDNSYHVIKIIDIGREADYLRWDPSSKRVVTGYGGAKDSGGLLFIDPNTYEVEKTPLDAPPEDFAIDPAGRYIYANLHDLSAIDVLDRQTGKITKWEYQHAFRPTPMALDAAGHRLFVGVRGPADLMVVDTDTGHEVARLPMGGLAADMLWDPQSRRIFNINSAGYINVIQQIDPNHYALVANIPTVVGARSGFLVAPIARLMIAVPAYGDRPAGLWEYQINAPRK